MFLLSVRVKEKKNEGGCQESGNLFFFNAKRAEHIMGLWDEILFEKAGKRLEEI